MFFNRYKETGFVGGGLILPEASKDLLSSMGQAPWEVRGFTSPAYIDSRPYTVKASNQGSEPSCAGHTFAALKGAKNWRRTGLRLNYDGDQCYREAKKIDGMPNVEGTTLHAAASAAIGLGWFSGRKITPVFSRRAFLYAMHLHGAVAIGFMTDTNWQVVDKRTGYIGDSKRTTSLGGHAVLACYYDEDSVGWVNSWDTSWGLTGLARMTWDQFDKQFHSAVVLDEAG